MVRFTLGRLTPLWSLSSPPWITLQITSVSVVSFTSSIILPSLISTLFPELTSLGMASYVTETISSVPSTSLVVIVKSWSSFSMTFPSLKVLIRISGPLVSRSTAAGIPRLSRTLLNISMFSLCSSWLPWEKFNLATFIPASRSFLIISSFLDEGPIVHIIFVLRIVPPLFFFLII